jgi:hypothetical protein
MEDVLRWRTHGGDFFFAQPYNDALIFGDPVGAAFTDLSQRLLADPRLLDRLGPAARRLVEARLGTVNLTDAAAIAATHGTGQLRRFGRKNELPAIDALERDVIDRSREQSTTAVLDKMSRPALTRTAAAPAVGHGSGYTFPNAPAFPKRRWNWGASAPTSRSVSFTSNTMIR